MNKEIILIALLTLFVTIAPIAVYKHITATQKQLIEQTINNYDSIYADTTKQTNHTLLLNF